MLKNLLIYKLVVFNIIASCVLFWCWSKGFVADMFFKDASYMTYVATTLFAAGSISLLIRASKISTLLNRVKTGRSLYDFNGNKLVEKAAHLEDIGDLIVTIGLIGTAIGVVIMLGSFDAGSLSDPAKVVETAKKLGEGIGTAFRSTIVSAIIWCWHIVNVRMLKTSTIMLIEDAQ